MGRPRTRNERMADATIPPTRLDALNETYRLLLVAWARLPDDALDDTMVSNHDEDWGRPQQVCHDQRDDGGDGRERNSTSERWHEAGEHEREDDAMDTENRHRVGRRTLHEVRLSTLDGGVDTLEIAHDERGVQDQGHRREDGRGRRG